MRVVYVAPPSICLTSQGPLRRQGWTGPGTPWCSVALSISDTSQEVRIPHWTRRVMKNVLPHSFSRPCFDHTSTGKYLIVHSTSTCPNELRRYIWREKRFLLSRSLYSSPSGAPSTTSSIGPAIHLAGCWPTHTWRSPGEWGRGREWPSGQE